MTFRSRIPLQLFQKYFIIKETISSIFSKLEVVTDSKALIYSVRILIILLALLMGYIHTPSKTDEASKTSQEHVQKTNIADTDKVGATINLFN